MNEATRRKLQMSEPTSRIEPLIVMQYEYTKGAPVRRSVERWVQLYPTRGIAYQSLFKSDIATRILPALIGEFEQSRRVR